MKIGLMLLFLMFTFYGQAKGFLNQSSLNNFRSISDVHKNLDNSYTIKNIQVLRGDLYYYIDSRLVTFSTVCKLLGFESSLSGPNFNKSSTLSGVVPTIHLNENAEFMRVLEGITIISKVTCYNAKELKPIVDFSKENNPDGSVKITKFEYHRGDLTFGIDATFEYKADAICKMIGYERALLGGNLFTYVTNIPTREFPYWEHLIKLNDDGYFISLDYGERKLTKINCYSDKIPELVVLIDGKRYRYQKP